MRLVKVLVSDERESVECVFHGWVVKDGDERIPSGLGCDVNFRKTTKYFAVIEDNFGKMHEVEKDYITFINHYSEVLKK